MTGEGTSLVELVRFGPWLPFGDVETAAPARAGLLQARAAGLLEYPSGRSPMVLYAASAPGETLAAFVAREGRAPLARAASAGAAFVRFAEADAPGPALARLLARFSERFGAPPRANT